MNNWGCMQEAEDWTPKGVAADRDNDRQLRAAESGQHPACALTCSPCFISKEGEFSQPVPWLTLLSHPGAASPRTTVPAWPSTSRYGTRSNLWPGQPQEVHWQV